jgi:hypothetical protein
MLCPGELEEAVEDAAERIQTDELPEITVPLYETARPSARANRSGL